MMPSKKCPILSLLLFCISFANANGYLISADTVLVSDNAKTLGGTIYGGDIEIGADAKVYGSVSAGSRCFLRERASISDTLFSSFTAPCARQNNVAIGREIFKRAGYSHSEIAGFSAGSQNISVSIEADETLLPGSYGSLEIDARSTVRLQSGAYVFSSIHTEPDVKWQFDLSGGPVKIYVQNGIRFADRNVFSIAGGNPSEIEWRVAGGNLDIGTDGKFFGRFIAPGSRIRLAPRSHIVGGVEARHFLMEPQATVSMEPRAEEISHSEYNFGPFWDRNIFRYRSAIPLSASAVEMYVYAGNFEVMVNGGASRNVNLEQASQKVSVSITRPFVADFPAEAFSGVYEFSFNKTANNRLYWNPASPCVSNCRGSSEETAFRSFAQALAEAQKEGLEIKMSGGAWEVPDEYRVFPAGLELIGSENPFWELSSFSDIPVLNVRNHPIEIAGKSPRCLAGLHITGGRRGALSASADRLELSGIAFTSNSSERNGGALRYEGKGLLVGRTLLFEGNSGNKGGAAFIGGSADIEDLVCSGNSSRGEGGCLFVQDTLRLANAVFSNNKSKKEGGGACAKNTSAFSVTAAGNNSGGYALAGISGKVSNSVFWSNSGGDIPASWAAEYSSFPGGRSGPGNISGDPKFADYGNPAGTAHFFGYDAGLVLADKSPALKGSKADGTPERDLIGTERGNSVAMGAYGDYSSSQDEKFRYGEWIFGKFEPALAMPQPLFANLPNQYIIDYVGYGGYGRMIRHLVRKHSKTNVSKAKVRIIVLDSSFNRYTDIKPVEVIFYRLPDDENGKYAFGTLTNWPLYPDYDPEKHGRLILFSKDPEDQGIHGNFLIINVKSDTDNFRYEVVEWW